MRAFVAIIISLLMIQGCASSLKGDVYARNEAQKTINFRWGTVESTRPVQIEGDRTEKGQIAGAVLGGVAGNGLTHSSTQGLATAVGVVAGAIAGQMAEEKMTRAQGLEITLKMDDGQNMVIVQEVEKINEYANGDRVKVISDNGKNRVSH